MKAKFGGKRSVYVYSGKGSGQHPEARTLLTGHPGTKLAEALRVTIANGTESKSSYHLYRGGKFLGFGLPKEHGAPGLIADTKVEILSVHEFVRDLRPIEYTNSQNLRWVADSAKLQRFKLKERNLTIYVEQENPICGPREFCFSGEMLHYPGISNQQHGVNLEFGVRDYANRIYEFRVRDDGFT